MNEQVDERAFLGKGWGFPVELSAAGDVELAAYEEDVKQALLLILGTSKGERTMRPDFGAGLQELVFEPLSTTLLALVRHRVEEALVLWEPRVDLREVRVTPSNQQGRLDVEIDYRVRATNTFYNLVYPFYLREGERP